MIWLYDKDWLTFDEGLIFVSSDDDDFSSDWLSSTGDCSMDWVSKSFPGGGEDDEVEGREEGRGGDTIVVAVDEEDSIILVGILSIDLLVVF